MIIDLFCYSDAAPVHLNSTGYYMHLLTMTPAALCVGKPGGDLDALPAGMFRLKTYQRTA